MISLKITSLKFLILLALGLIVNQVNAQDTREFYFGLDIGPKMDRYFNSSSSNEYKPNVKVINDIGANAGIVGGFRINDEILLEAGLYKNDYKMKLEFISEQRNVFFKNSLIKTITSVGVPISINMKLKKGSPVNQWYAGVGFMPLMNVKTENDGISTGLVEEIQNDKGEVTDQLEYSVSEQSLNGSIVSANLSLRYNRVLSKGMVFHVMGTVRLGVSGRNEFGTTHSTLNHSSVENSFYTKGGGYNLNFGFRYYLQSDSESE